MPIQPFNKEAIYDDQIAPLMKQIIDICKAHGIPMLATFNYRSTDGEDAEESYCTTCLPRVIDGKDHFPEEIAEAHGIIRCGASTRAKIAAFTITKK